MNETYSFPLCGWIILLGVMTLLGLPIAARLQKKKGITFWQAVQQGAGIIFLIYLGIIGTVWLFSVIMRVVE